MSNFMKSFIWASAEEIAVSNNNMQAIMPSITVDSEFQIIKATDTVLIKAFPKEMALGLFHNYSQTE